MKFKEFLKTENQEQLHETHIQTLLVLAENVDFMNESNAEEIVEGVNTHLNKVGLKLHKSKGILNYIKQFTTSIGKLFLHLIKGDTKKAKELVMSLEKEDVLDFLYKLDLGTLHLFTGPIHTIDAWTGWDLSVKLKDKVQSGASVLQSITTALNNVKQSVHKLFDDAKRKRKILDNIESLEVEIVK